MSEPLVRLGNGFNASPNFSVGVFVVSDYEGSQIKTFPLGSTMEEMERWVEGYLAGQASIRDQGRVRLCGMVGAG